MSAKKNGNGDKKEQKKSEELDTSADEEQQDTDGEMTEEHPDQQRAEKEEQAAKDQEEASGETGDKNFDLTVTTPAKDFPVVGIGASAGGVDTLKELFRHIDKKSGMAYVVVMHLSPDRKSVMPEILRKQAPIPVSEIEDGMAIEPDHVYLNPSDKDVYLEKGVFKLRDIHGMHSERMPIDRFFRSLAQDQSRNAICLILSGSGTDGTQGLKTIKETDGLVIAQSPDDAEYTGMPKSAINSGFVDFTLSLDEIPGKIAEFTTGSTQITTEDGEEESTQKQLKRLFEYLHNYTGHDFSNYKMSTVQRRIERRMNVNRMSDLQEYLNFLQKNRSEAGKLFRELLISVTNFFRDPEAFDVLQDQVLEPMIERKSASESLRIWVPGCATGEEAYSIAILIEELLNKHGKSLETQIFATDLDSRAIEQARKGKYPDSISMDVSKQRLNAFFERKGDYFYVNNRIRQMLIIAEQNLLKDPPFKNIDLVSCRNLLIYLNASIQKKLIPLLHYSLHKNGYLFLGNSESVGEHTDLFVAESQKHKIFRAKAAPHKDIEVLGMRLSDNLSQVKQKSVTYSHQKPSIADLAEDALLKHFGPPSVVVDQNGDIKYVHGRTGKYLEPASGEAKMNVHDMAREGLATELYGAINRLNRSDDDQIRLNNVLVQTNGEHVSVDVELHRIALNSDDPKSHVIISFIEHEDLGPDQEGERTDFSDIENKDERIKNLENELESTRENLQTKIEEYQTTNEELKSSNEELQSANEELQSTNEELETAKEELQSVNEEMETVNDQLNEKNRELSRAHSDLRNLMNSIDVPVLFLDTENNIKRFTDPVKDLINVIDDDEGRNISNFSTSLKEVDISEEANQVLKDLRPVEKEVQTRDDHWYRMNIIPYRTVDNVIDGVVFSFIDINNKKMANQKLKKINEQVRRERKFAEEIIKTVRNPLVVLNEELQVESANPAYYRMFNTSETQLLGQNLMELDNQRWNVEHLEELLKKILPEKSTIKDFELKTNTPEQSDHSLLLNAREIETPEGKEKRILLSIESKTDQKQKK